MGAREMALPSRGYGSLCSPNSGLVLSGNLDADLVSIALDMADEQRRKPQGLRFHSDPGSQYRSRYFHKRLWRHRISQRMNRRGNCYDNSPMVRVFRRLKNEWIPPVGYMSIQQVQRDMTSSTQWRASARSGTEKT